MTWYKNPPNFINSVGTLVYAMQRGLLFRWAEGNAGDVKSRETNNYILDKEDS